MVYLMYVLVMVYLMYVLVLSDSHNLNLSQPKSLLGQCIACLRETALCRVFASYAVGRHSVAAMGAFEYPKDKCQKWQ